ncbi:MAG: trehalose-phosphatase [Cyclobacteriaceae bacterium]
MNKGKAAARWLDEAQEGSFVLAIGDDWTDEDTFKAMPDSAFTIKVGDRRSAARFSVKDHSAVRKILSDLGSVKV